jgi:hypothetical protein
LLLVALSSQVDHWMQVNSMIVSLELALIAGAFDPGGNAAIAIALFVSVEHLRCKQG